MNMILLLLLLYVCLLNFPVFYGLSDNNASSLGFSDHNIATVFIIIIIIIMNFLMMPLDNIRAV